MFDAAGAQRAREWLERQLAELGQLRNASKRDQNFKNWRQQTLTVIQRIWPGDTRRVERFRRIPFSPPSAHVNDRQVREYYERGWGEAGIVLRELLAEINLLGLSQMQSNHAHATEESMAGPDFMPTLDLPGGPRPDEPKPGAPRSEAPALAAVSAEPPAAPASESSRDDILRAMERLLGGASLSRKQPPAPSAAADAPATPVAADVPATPAAADATAAPIAADRTAAPAAERIESPPPVAPAELFDFPLRHIAAEELLEMDALAADFVRLAADLDRLGLTPARADDVREVLLVLARETEAGQPSWELVSAALADAGATPALARRVLPLLLEIVARAA